MDDSIKILVVEDDKSMVMILENSLDKILKLKTINWAVSLEKAIEQLIHHSDIIQKKPYDLIIADIILEGQGTGLDLYKVVNGLYPHVPFLIITALSFRELSPVINKYRKKNFNYLQKPFRYSTFKDKINQILINNQTQYADVNE